MITCWRIVFGLAAAYNIAVGAAILLMPASLASAPFTGSPQEALLIQSCGWLILVFGVGYAMVAMSPMMNRGIAALGVLGKSAMPVIAYPFYTAGQIPWSSYVLTLGDLGFVALFILFLLWSRPRT
jgi:hypothetical protein